MIQNIPFPCAQEQGQYIYSARFCDRDTVFAGGSGTNSAKVIYYPTGDVSNLNSSFHKETSNDDIQCRTPRFYSQFIKKEFGTDYKEYDFKKLLETVSVHGYTLVLIFAGDWRNDVGPSGTSTGLHWRRSYDSCIWRWNQNKNCQTLLSLLPKDIAKTY